MVNGHCKLSNIQEVPDETTFYWDSMGTSSCLGSFRWTWFEPPCIQVTSCSIVVIIILFHSCLISVIISWQRNAWILHWLSSISWSFIYFCTFLAVHAFMVWMRPKPLWKVWFGGETEHRCPYVTLFCQDICSNCTLQIFRIAESLEKKREKVKMKGFQGCICFTFFFMTTDLKYDQSSFLWMNIEIGRDHPFWTKILVYSGPPFSNQPFPFLDFFDMSIFCRLSILIALTPFLPLYFHNAQSKTQPHTQNGGRRTKILTLRQPWGIYY